MKRSLQCLADACEGRLTGEDREFGAVSIDTRTLGAGDLFVALRGEHADGHDFAAAAAERGACALLVSRQVPVGLPQVVVADTLAALARGASAWRKGFELPMVGVGGSNGKTTTKELLASILQQRGHTLATRGNLNNHIGVPLTLFRLEPVHRAAVIEMGANHPGEIAALVRIAAPTVGLVTNAGAEHLEGFGSLEGVARAEGEMYAGLGSGETAVMNADDAFAPLWRELSSQAGRCITFGIENDADFRAHALVSGIEGGAWVSRFGLDTPVGTAQLRLALPGRHNVLNAAAAAAAAWACGASLPQIVAGLAGVQPVRGRLQLKPALRGAWLIDDSYNANPTSVLAGLEVLGGLGGERWLALGEMAELGDYAVAAHAEIGRAARVQGMSRLFAVGPTTLHAVEAFGQGGRWFPDTAALAAALGESLRPGITVLVKGSRVNRLEEVVAALVDAPPAACNGN
jgi:UDP-N-acetylmuramoyl-tripeptide--D-alanyl-D-alanine ligase